MLTCAGDGNPNDRRHPLSPFGVPPRATDERGVRGGDPSDGLAVVRFGGWWEVGGGRRGWWEVARAYVEVCGWGTAVGNPVYVVAAASVLFVAFFSGV